MNRVVHIAVDLLISAAVAAALLLTPAPTQAQTPPPPGDPVPIGAAVHPGDRVDARLLGTDVRVRSYPDTRDGHVLSLGQRHHQLDAHCTRLMRTSGNRIDPTWIYVTHRQISGEDLRGWVNSRYLRADRPLPRCNPGV